MHLIYRLVEGNAEAAERLYGEKYPRRDTSDTRMFANLHPICVNMDHYGKIGIENDEKMTSHLHDSKTRLSTVCRISTERGEKG
ncbi:hypothetical protein TNCV_5093381 [Trichonephila clavipes]|nr:hypothetical protein TNCV_5093381 [Trichonephila clavipes]